MPSRRLQVFISSTIADLAPAREEVDRVLSELDIFDVIRSEKLPAQEDPSRRVCLAEVQASDVVVLLVGAKYGHVPQDGSPQGLSVTHLEVREARRAGIPLFAFPQALETEREEAVARLLTEVEDFDSGVFRKTWTAPKQLAGEVRRSLLFWLTRRVRAGQTVPVEGVALQQALTDTTDTLALQIDSRGNDEGGKWFAEQVPEIAAEAKRLLLPLPVIVPKPGDDQLRIKVDITGLTLEHCDMQMRVVDSPADDSGKSEARTRDNTLPLSIRLHRGPTGQSALRSALLALMRWTNDDPAGAAATLSELADSERLSGLTRANLLAMAMWMSSGQGQIVRLGERLLTLNALDEHAFLLASQALFLLQAGEHLGAGSPHSHLSRRAIAVHLRLCHVALTTGAAGTEAVYSLAKLLAFPSPERALQLFIKLREIEPDYDRRWYWHRDVGQIHYSAGRLKRAAPYYDRACELKSKDAQLWRWAGDAYCGLGHWPRALERYEAAVKQDPYEVYFLKEKVAFCRHAIRTRRPMLSQTRERLAAIVSPLAERVLYRWPRSGLGRRLAEAVARLAPLSRDCREALALAANRQGQYDWAIRWLKESLACQPERAMTRLNLCANLLFKEGGRWSLDATWQARAAVALRGPSAGPKLALLLTNTSTREALMAEFDATIVPVARSDWETHLELRKKVLAPELFGTVLHSEGPDQFPPA